MLSRFLVALAPAFMVVTLLPSPAASAGPDGGSEVVYTAASSDTASSAASGTCITLLDHEEDGVGVVTINFSGETACTGAILLEVKARLFTPLGNLEAEGNSGAGLGFAKSSGSFGPTPVGTTHVLNYVHTMTTTDGGIWLGADPDCRGFGTPTLTCERDATFIAGREGFVTT